MPAPKVFDRDHHGVGIGSPVDTFPAEPTLILVHAGMMARRRLRSNVRFPPNPVVSGRPDDRESPESGRSAIGPESRRTANAHLQPLDAVGYAPTMTLLQRWSDLRRSIRDRLTGAKTQPPRSVADMEAMLHEGLELARNGDVDEALTIADELEELRFTGCFEVRAVALNEMGDREKAIETLRHSLDIKPVWRNAHLLGIYLSDEGLYDEALQSFDASLSMHASEPKATAYNKAITLDRMGRVEDARAVLTGISTTDEIDDEPDITEMTNEFLAKLQGRASPA
jgi:tetratricopeptide (TPR) repeat protein